MKPFKAQIFMGNGHFSMAECYQVHKLVEECIETLGGVQQEGLQGSEVNKSNLIEAEYDVNRKVEQIVLALTGQRIKIKDKPF
jgi:hypothetical protein